MKHIAPLFLILTLIFACFWETFRELDKQAKRLTLLETRVELLEKNIKELQSGTLGVVLDTMPPESCGWAYYSKERRSLYVQGTHCPWAK